MAQVYTNITLPLTKQTVIYQVEMPQGDRSRGLDILLSDEIISTSEEGFASTMTATLWGKKPSGLDVSFNASRVIAYSGSGTYRIIFDGSDTFANLIAERGIVRCTVTINDGDSSVATFAFNIKAVDNMALMNEGMSTEEYANIVEALDRIRQKEAQLDDLISQLTDQAKLTVNVRYGTSEPTVQAGDKEGDLYIQIK